MTTNNYKEKAIDKLYRILGDSSRFWKFVLLLIIAGLLTVAGICAWKGCEVHTKNNHIKIKSEAPKNANK